MVHPQHTYLEAQQEQLAAAAEVAQQSLPHKSVATHLPSVVVVVLLHLLLVVQQSHTTANVEGKILFTHLNPQTLTCLIVLDIPAPLSASPLILAGPKTSGILRYEPRLLLALPDY